MNQHMKIVISMGGSILYPVDLKFIGDLAESLRSIEHGLYIITGGGKISREYIRKAREYGAKEDFLDEIGIHFTRINALFLIAALGKNVNEKVPFTTGEAAVMEERIVVMGGTIPGHSTDTVGAELAKKVEAERLIIATDVDGVYLKDPKRDSSAKKLDRIAIDELLKLSGKEWKRAGGSYIIDGPACKIIKDGRIPTFVVNGKDLKALVDVINGKSFDGTIIEV